MGVGVGVLVDIWFLLQMFSPDFFYAFVVIYVVESQKTFCLYKSANLYFSKSEYSHVSLNIYTTFACKTSVFLFYIRNNFRKCNRPQL